MSELRRRSEVAKIVNCECGYVARGEDFDSVIAATEEHIRREHPELVGKYDRDELFALVEEA
jgi:hypothetical protein